MASQCCNLSNINENSWTCSRNVDTDPDLDCYQNLTIGPWQRPTPQKLHPILFITCWDTLQNVSLHPVCTNGKESWKMIQDPWQTMDRQQNLIDWSLSHTPPLQKISSKSVENFCRYCVHQKWLHTLRHTQTPKYIARSVADKKKVTNF